MNKSKSKLVAKSNSCSPTSTSSSSSCDEESPELLPQNLVYKYPVAAKTIISCKRRPVMGITALMLNNYKQQQASVSNGFTTTWPNVYLLGLPIVFNTQHHTEPTTTTTTPSRKTKSSRRSVDANNNNMDSDNGFRLEIYGENINESIRI